MSAFLSAALDQIVSGAFPLPVRTYKANAVPASPKYPYSVVVVAPSTATQYTLDATHSVRNYRIWVQSFSTTLDGALDYDDTATGALLDQRLNVWGYDCGPIRLQVTGPPVRDPDAGGVVSVTSVFTFTTTKEA